MFGFSLLTLRSSRIAFFAERRTRLLAGLKRYFVGKRLNGLLSVEGLRILQYACDKAADDPETPLSVWTELQKEIGGRWGTRLASRMLFSMTRGFRNMPKLLQRMLGWPYKKLAGLIRRFLGRKMLVACEVAVEFYLGVTNSHQVNWLKGHANECWVLTSAHPFR